MLKGRLLKGIMSLGIGFSLVAGVATTSHSAEKITIRVVTAWAKAAQYETQQFLSYLDGIQKEADQKYPGQLAFDYKGAGEVIPTQQQIEALRSGLVDMVMTAASYTTAVMPEMDVMGLTRLTPWEERKTGVFDYLDKLFNAKANAHYTARLGSGETFYIFLSKPIKRIDDFKGMKIRVGPSIIPFIKSLGAEPVVTPPAEIYTAMERSLVSGYVQPLGSIRTQGLFPVTKYMVRPGIFQPITVVLTNLDVWKKMPDHLKNLITEHMKKAEVAALESIGKRLETEMEEAKKAKIAVIQLPKDDAAKFSKLADDAVMDVVLKKAPEEGKKLLQMVTKK
jgi:TRAP-type C4-dicarboxylate transport system substrate-binding protein